MVFRVRVSSTSPVRRTSSTPGHHSSPSLFPCLEGPHLHVSPLYITVPPPQGIPCHRERRGRGRNWGDRSLITPVPPAPRNYVPGVSFSSEGSRDTRQEQECPAEASPWSTQKTWTRETIVGTVGSGPSTRSRIHTTTGPDGSVVCEVRGPTTVDPGEGERRDRRYRGGTLHRDKDYSVVVRHPCPGSDVSSFPEDRSLPVA